MAMHSYTVLYVHVFSPYFLFSAILSARYHNTVITYIAVHSMTASDFACAIKRNCITEFHILPIVDGPPGYAKMQTILDWLVTVVS